MITTSLTWNITDLKRHSSDGFVYEIRYSVTGVSTETVGGASTTFQHVMNGGYMVQDHTRTGSEIAFSDLTETQIVNWVKAGIGSDDVATFETIIPGHLSAMRDGSLDFKNFDTNDTSSGLPWE